MRSRLVQPIWRLGSSRRRGFGIGRCAAAAMMYVIVCAVATRGVAATTSATGQHALTVVIEFPDPGLVDSERMCLTLFDGADVGLTKPLQTRCLTSRSIGVTFDGLPAASYRIVVPGLGSTIPDGRYEGQIVSTEIPAQPGVLDYVVQVQLALALQPSPTTGTQLLIQAFVCPAATDGGGNQAAWAAACDGRGNGISFGVLDRQGTPVRSVVTGQDGAPPGSAVIGDLAPGRYQLKEQVPDNVESVPVWFIRVGTGGQTAPLGADGSFDLRQSDRVTIWAYNVLRGLGSAPVTLPSASPSVSPTPAPVPAASPTAVIARRLPAAGAGQTSGGWPATLLALSVLVALALAGSGRIRSRRR